MKFRMVIILVLALAAILAAGLNAPGVTQAQEQEKYIDLSVEFTVRESNDADDMRNQVWLTNRGNQTAYDVRVILKQVNPPTSSTNNRIIMAPCCLMGTVDVEANEFATDNTVTWSIPSLPPHTESFITFKSGHNKQSDTFFYEWSATAESLSSYESPDRLHDNAAEAFLYGTIRIDIPQPSYYVRVSTDGTEEFIVDVLNKYDDNSNEFGQDPTGNVSYASDVCVNIWLSPGLTAGTATTNSDTRFPNLQYYAQGQRECGGTTATSGVLYVGGPVDLSRSPQPKLTLPVTVGEAGPYCLTAEIFARPPTGPGLHRDDPADNVAKACLGAAPAGERAVLHDGTVDLFTWYDCIGKTAAPCNENDSLELVVFSGTVFQPSQVVVVIPDPEGRTVDNSSNLVWSTGVANFTGLPGGKDRPGAVIAVNASLLNYMSTTNDPGNWGIDHPTWTDWHTGHIKVTAVVPTDDQGNPLGEIKGWRKQATPDELFWGNDVDPNDATNPTLLMNYNMYLGDSTKAVGGWRDERYIEFSALGTYLLTVTTTVEYDDDGDSNTNTASYSDTETYTFHVGPLADLSVVDGGASGVASGRTAYTILAANNGPEHTVDAEVKIALPSDAQVEDYVASEGTYANGVWTLPGLKMRDYRRSQGKPGEATLTLILKDGGIPKEPATATISLTENSYNVCIASDRSTLAHANETDCEAVSGASWHEGTVYDPPANSTTKITATKGTDGGPGSPGMRGAKSNTRSVTLTWGAVKTVNSIPTGHYEVQKYIRDEGRETWQTVSGPVPDTQWTDFNVGSGAMPPYRVRAVNAAGIGGPWSATYHRLTARQQGQLTGPSLTAKTTTSDTVRLTWTEPSNQQGAITGYELEYLSGDTWTTLVDNLEATEREYEDTGLPAGAERRYRVRAVSGEGPGRWSNVAVTFTPPAPPARFGAEPNGPNHILLTWDPGGSAVTRFELEMSSTGQDGNYSRLTSLSGTTRSYNHNVGAIHPEVRYYRIRACNNAGCGDWSWPESSTTAPRGAPAAPGLTARASSATEIKLSWTARADAVGYQLQHSTGGGYWDDLDLYPATATEFVHQADFGGGTTHYYRVRAWSRDENARTLDSAWSAIRSVTIAAGLPGQPTVSFSEATDDTLTLTWTVPETNGSRITGYRVERNDRGNSGYDNWVRVGTTGASVTTYTDRNLYSGEWLCYRVAATSNVGTGAYSEEACESTTGQWAYDPDPPLVRLSSVSPTGVTIAWDPPADDGGRPVQSYLYEQADEDGNFDGSCQYHSGDRELWSDACKMVSSGTRSATFSGLTAGSSAKFRVRAETTYSYGDWAIVTAHLPAASDDSETDGVTEDLQVRLSTTSLTVSEGRAASYTVRLNKAPQENETVRLVTFLDGSDIADIFIDYEVERACSGFEGFNRDNWNRGCTIKLTTVDDRDAEDEIAIMEHSIMVGGREVSGPGVRVLVRDND